MSSRRLAPAVLLVADWDIHYEETLVRDEFMRWSSTHSVLCVSVCGSYLGTRASPISEARIYEEQGKKGALCKVKKGALCRVGF